jgi:hypothetical protein
MIALGAHVRVQDRRYVAGLAVLDGVDVIDTFSVAAPSDDEARSLSELYRRAHDMMTHHAPSLVVLLAHEGMSGATLGVARRAEGVVLAAAGDQDRSVHIYKKGASLRKPTGLTGTGTVKATVADVVGMIRGLDTPPSEVAYAAAAAFAGSR